jgi:PAS domain S-box-containing protein
VIGLANKPGGFGDSDARMAEAFGETIAISLREHRTREELRRNRAHLQAIFDSTADYIMLLGDAHRVQLVNRTEPRLDPEQVLGTPLHELAEPDDRGRVEELLDDVARLRESRTYDTTYRRPDGTATHFNSIASPVVSSGESMGIVVVSRDVTEQKKMEAQLAQADRLSSMGMLAAGVAHEINNPLSYALYNLRSLQDDLPGLLEAMRVYQTRLNDHLGRAAVEAIVGSAANGMNPAMLADIQDRIHDAYKGTQRIRDIARGLGTFSRVEEDKLVPVSLIDVIEAALSMCFNELKYRARVVKDYGKTRTVMASEGRLSQVFLNLFVNAAHAIEEGDVASNEIRVRTWTQGETICAEVRDTGSGIDPAHLEKLFEPFFTTKETGVGSGLGLPISKGIVEGYGGTITVNSELGRGTSVEIRLPGRVEVVVPAASVQVAEDAGSVHGRILVVDDEEGMRTAMVRMLRGHETVLASTGEVAKGILEDDPAFDLILCDMMMPKVSGMDLHRWLAQENPHLAEQVIFITGGAFTPRAQDYLSTVDNLWLEKPLDVGNFKKIVNDRVRLVKGLKGA